MATSEFRPRSTIHAVLDRHGLVKRGGGPRYCARGTPLSEGAAPNDLWCADFKGEFKLGNGRYCYPLTVTDHASRFLLLCEALESTREETAFTAFQRLFAERGLPTAIIVAFLWDQKRWVATHELQGANTKFGHIGSAGHTRARELARNECPDYLKYRVERADGQFVGLDRRYAYFRYKTPTTVQLGPQKRQPPPRLPLVTSGPTL